MRRVLLISPHFPPDFTAAAHRVRLLAPYLQRYGWEPTVLTVDAGAYEAGLDPGLARMVPSSLRVVRCGAWSARRSRIVGIGDLGLRSLGGFYRRAVDLMRAERFDALFITIFPAYTALLGPVLAKRFKVPFVLDYQDPWVNLWGETMGGGPNGSVDFKSRVAGWLARTLEPRVVRGASGITAVSPGTYGPVLERNPTISPVHDAIPIGADPADFGDERAVEWDTRYFDPADGRFHLCYVGTFPPAGYETLTAMCDAVRLLRERRADLYDKLRIHFFGTSGQSTYGIESRVMAVVKSRGIDDVVTEVPARLPYSTAIAIQKKATALVALGSTEPHYTASRVFPFLLAKRPLLAVYHEASTVVELLRRIARAPTVRLRTYSDDRRAETTVEGMFEDVVALIEQPVWNDADVETSGLREYFAENLAGRLAHVFDQVAAR